MNRPDPEDFTTDRYRLILEAALAAGYRFIGFDAMAAARLSGDPVCALRHDCDNDPTAALRMAEIEAAMGVRSTYFLMLRSAMYNLMAKPHYDHARSILALGHHLGFHFDYSCYGDIGPEDIAARGEEESRMLERLLDRPVTAVSFHQPSAMVLDNHVKLSRINTYDPGDNLGFHYLSDSNMHWREGCPSAIFSDRRHPRLHLLVHPEWWTPEPMDVGRKWQAMFRNNFAATQAVLLRTERSYGPRLHLEFQS